METEQNFAVVEAMEKYGGSFVAALATAMRRADTQNFWKLRLAFPEIWNQYTDMAAKDNGGKNA